MKKLMFLVLLIVFVLPLVCGAESAYLPDHRRRLTTLVKTSDAVLSSSEFRIASDVLIGYKVFGSAVLVGIYDVAAVTDAATASVITEAETSLYTAAANNAGVTECIFPYPKKFTTSPCIIFNDAEIDSVQVPYGVILYIEQDWAQYN